MSQIYRRCSVKQKMKSLVNLLLWFLLYLSVPQSLDHQEINDGAHNLHGGSNV
jgi:hypothetical protein